MNSLQQALEVIVDRKNQIEQSKKQLILSAVSLGITAASVACDVTAKTLSIEADNLSGAGYDERAAEVPGLRISSEKLSIAADALNLANPAIRLMIDQLYENNGLRKAIDKNLYGGRETLNKKAAEPAAGAGLDRKVNAGGGYFNTIANLEAEIAAANYASRNSQNQIQALEQVKSLNEQAVRSVIDLLNEAVSFTSSTIQSEFKIATYAVNEKLLNGASVADLSKAEKELFFFNGMSKTEIDDYLARLNAANHTVAVELAKALNLLEPVKPAEQTAPPSQSSANLLVSYADSIMARVELQNNYAAVSKEVAEHEKELKNAPADKKEHLEALINGEKALKNELYTKMNANDAVRGAALKSVKNNAVTDVDADKTSLLLQTRTESDKVSISQIKNPAILQYIYNNMHKDVFQPLSKELQEQQTASKRFGFSKF